MDPLFAKPAVQGPTQSEGKALASEPPLQASAGGGSGPGRAQLGARRPPEAEVREPEGGGWHP